MVSNVFHVLSTRFSHDGFHLRRCLIGRQNGMRHSKKNGPPEPPEGTNGDAARKKAPAEAGAFGLIHLQTVKR